MKLERNASRNRFRSFELPQNVMGLTIMQMFGVGLMGLRLLRLACLAAH
jgi:hypothetical protein